MHWIYWLTHTWEPPGRIPSGEARLRPAGPAGEHGVESCRVECLWQFEEADEHDAEDPVALREEALKRMAGRDYWVRPDDDPWRGDADLIVRLADFSKSEFESLLLLYLRERGRLCDEGLSEVTDVASFEGRGDDMADAVGCVQRLSAAVDDDHYD